MTSYWPSTDFMVKSMLYSLSTYPVSTRPKCRVACQATANMSKTLNSKEIPQTRGPWALALCLTTNLAMGQSSKSSDIRSLSIPGRQYWAYFCPMGILCPMGSSFRDNGWFSKLPYLGMKLAYLGMKRMLGHWPKFQKWHIYSLSPRQSKLSSLSLYGQQNLRYWPNFKTVIFRHEFQK